MSARGTQRTSSWAEEEQAQRRDIEQPARVGNGPVFEDDRLQRGIMLHAEDEEGIGRVLKPTGWPTNPECIADAEGGRCSNMHGGEPFSRALELNLRGMASAFETG